MTTPDTPGPDDRNPKAPEDPRSKPAPEGDPPPDGRRSGDNGYGELNWEGDPDEKKNQRKDLPGAPAPKPGK